MGQVGVNLSKISAIQNADQNHDRDRDARGIYGKLVGDNVARVKGPAKTVCRQIMLKSHIQI